MPINLMLLDPLGELRNKWKLKVYISGSFDVKRKFISINKVICFNKHERNGSCRSNFDYFYNEL